MRTLFLALLAVLPGLASAQYNVDSSKWSSTGLMDYSFTSPIFNQSAVDEPFTTDCSQAQPFEEDGNGATIGQTIDLGAMTGGQINLIVHAAGTMDTATGVFTASSHQSGLNVEFPVTIPNLGTFTFVLQSIDQTGTFTVSGHDTCFIAGQWRDPGTTMVSDPATTGGTYKGYIKTIFSPKWTLVVSNTRSTATKCECPGVPISGIVDLQQFVPGPNGQSVNFIVRQGTTVENLVGTLDASGAYTIQAHIPGIVEVLAKETHWLQAKVAGVNVTSGPATGVDFSLPNGDIAEDNFVGLYDLNSVLLAFAQPGPEDIDGTGLVDLFDLNIVLGNFGLAGDS